MKNKEINRNKTKIIYRKKKIGKMNQILKLKIIKN